MRAMRAILIFGLTVAGASLLLGASSRPAPKKRQASKARKAPPTRTKSTKHAKGKKKPKPLSLGELKRRLHRLSKEARQAAKQAQQSSAQARLMAHKAKEMARKARQLAMQARLALREVKKRALLTEVELRWQIDQWEIRERAALVAYAHTEWKKYTRDPKLSTKASYNALLKIRGEKEIFTILQKARKQKTAKDPQLKRRVQMLWDSLREYHLSKKANELRKQIHVLTDKLNGIQASYRAIFEGKKVSNRALRMVLRRDSNRKRREAAWRAYASVGPKVLAGGFMKLVQLRNQYAKQLGFPTFFHYRYKKLHLQPDKMWLLYEELRRKTEKAYEATRKAYKGLLKSKQFMPWDRRYAAYLKSKQVVNLDAFFRADRLLPVLFQAYQEMGFALKGMSIKMDLYPRPNKNQHAYCFDIDPPYDIRILANVGQPGQRAYETMLHEMGHAVHGKLVKQDVRTFRLLPDEGFLNEGSANFFGNLVDSRAFFARYLKIPKATLAKIVAMKQKSLNQRLYNIRWTLLWMYFERDLYINDQLTDPTRLFWERYKQFQGDIPPKAPPYWGVLIHFVSHPIYYQNYLIADLLAAQLHEAVKQKTQHKSVLNNPQVANFLSKHFFSHGRRYRWDELMKRITGKPLTAKAYLRALKTSWH